MQLPQLRDYGLNVRVKNGERGQNSMMITADPWRRANGVLSLICRVLSKCYEGAEANSESRSPRGAD
jgi:hypothetical protein